MNPKTTAVTIAAALAVVAMNAGPASAANSGNTNCPAAFQRLSVAYMESVGPYIVPAYVDQHGNNNGYVCGLQLPPSREQADCQTGGTIACELIQLGLPLYNFTDDDVPSKKSPATGA